MATPVHTCHAHGCDKPVPTKMFACRRHWFALRKPLRDAIWREYRPGQEVDKRPSLRYLAVQQRAVAELATNAFGADVAATYIAASEDFRAKAVAAGLGDPLVALVQTS